MDGTILRPELAALGATDGQLLSGRAVDNDDPLSRRDQGLEFLDVAERVRAERIDGNPSQRAREDVYRLTNISDSVVDPHLLVIVRGLPSQVRLENAGGTTKDGDPYLRVFLEDGVLEPGERITRRLVFTGSAARRRLPAYDITLLSGQGMPWRSSPALEMTTPRSPPRPGCSPLWRRGSRQPRGVARSLSRDRPVRAFSSRSTSMRRDSDCRNGP